VGRTTRTGLTLAAVTTAGLLWAGLGTGNDRPPAAIPDLPGAPAPALEVGHPEWLSRGRFISRWTIVRAAAVAHERPDQSSHVIAKLATSTPEGTPNALAVVQALTAEDGALWIQVRLPVLPNGTLGWVRRTHLGPYGTVDTRLVVDRARLRATLYHAGRRVFDAPVGVGTAGSPTPTGEFLVRNELKGYLDPFYGPVAFGTTARATVLTDWPAGGFVGIHGTNQPQLVPGRISHGCIRLRNRDILRLAALMPVGTPVTIR
jgi:hypothetical protein